MGVTALRRRWLVLGAGSLVALSGSLWASPIVHEYFQPDPAEDLRLGATTPSGRMPAALDTPSGVVSAPSLERRSEAERHVYGGSRGASGGDAYHLDRLTSAPSRVEYDEPFRPALLPFKRSHAFDLVSEDFSLGVRRPELVALPIGGQAGPDEEPFFAEFVVDLEPGRAARVPSVGPGARALFLEADPPLPLELLVDGADNWFVRGARGGRVRLIMQVAWAARPVPADFGWSAGDRLRELAPPLPAEASRAARGVIEELGLAGEDPATTLTRLVTHFRAFRAADEPPRARTAAELYVELTTRQQGVCRHRAYAFLVTALELGIPTRLVHNEAHAWVEVSDGEAWYRVDLGGAPADLSLTREPSDVPAHRPPLDPFAWPSGSSSGAQSSARNQGPGSWPSARSGGSAPSGAPSPPAAAPTSAPFIELRLERERLRRGGLLGVRGHVSEGGRPCARSRVDLYVQGGGAPRFLGSLPSDARGDFSGQVALPLDLPLGAQSVHGALGAPCRAP